MKPITRNLTAALLALGLCFSTTSACIADERPQLIQGEHGHYLKINNKPFLIRGGELDNSSASSMEYMAPIWPKMQAMHLNTLLVPLYWEQIEPAEGKFDFGPVDALIKDARRHDMKLVFLWFGSWKNSMSSYTPNWVKRDPARFPRALSAEGVQQEILTPFSRNNLEADKKAYVALMKHIKKTDAKYQTVIMMQVENEIGMLPSARDHHPEAVKAYDGQAPEALMTYLSANKDALVPELADAWAKQGFKTQGTWREVFGDDIWTEERFMAWHFARYTNEITEAGKAVYPIPAFVNAALNHRNVLPGQYPSAGPLPQVFDIWKAGAPSIDLLAPDYYNPDFKHWSDLFVRQGDPLFIPEHRFDNTVAAKAFFAYGHYDFLGFSPYDIDSAQNPSEQPIAKTYDIIKQTEHLLLNSKAGETRDGVWLTKENPQTVVQLEPEVSLIVKHDNTLGWTAASKQDEWSHAGAIIVKVDKETYYVFGTGVVLTLKSEVPGKVYGFDRIDEGRFINGEWKTVRLLNGDQSHQGRHVRIPEGVWDIQKFKVYPY
ncbi:MAG: DUF5597 domain-containing protein [Cellvibrio sp.]